MKEKKKKKKKILLNEREETEQRFIISNSHFFEPRIDTCRAVRLRLGQVEYQKMAREKYVTTKSDDVNIISK